MSTKKNKIEYNEDDSEDEIERIVDVMKPFKTDKKPIKVEEPIIKEEVQQEPKLKLKKERSPAQIANTVKMRELLIAKRTADAKARDEIKTKIIAKKMIRSKKKS